MTRPDDDLLDDFAQEAEDLASLDDLNLVGASVLPKRPRSDLRARVLEAAVAGVSRFERFTPQVARMLEVDETQARAILDRIDDPSVWSADLPSTELYWVDGGPRLADYVRGFVRIDAGFHFPEHEHLGDEHTLVLQGSWTDSKTGKVFHPGDEDRMTGTTSHGLRVTPDGPDLLQLVVTHRGYRIGDQIIGPR